MNYDLDINIITPHFSTTFEEEISPMKQQFSELYDHDYLMSQIPCNLYWKDREGNYLGCNETFAQILNLKCPEEILGRNDYDFFLEPEYVKKIIETDQRVIQTGQVMVLEEIGTGLNDRLATFMTKKIPLKNKKGEIMGVLGVSIDITKEKQAKVAKSEFLQNMAHDIRTPICGIYGIAESLYHTTADIYQKEMLGYIFEGAEHLLKLLNQILEVSSLGSLPIEKTCFDIHDLVSEVAKLMAPAIHLKNLNLEVVCPHQQVNTDQTRIHRILLNLLGNAIKFTEEGGITIRVTSDSQLTIEIEDTGIGIPEDKLEVIFEKFSRLQPSYKQSTFTGSGIGLHISRHFARELNGDINVTSQLGKGSCFVLSVPL